MLNVFTSYMIHGVMFNPYYWNMRHKRRSNETPHLLKNHGNPPFISLGWICCHGKAIIKAKNFVTILYNSIMD